MRVGSRADCPPRWTQKRWLYDPNSLGKNINENIQKEQRNSFVNFEKLLNTYFLHRTIDDFLAWDIVNMRGGNGWSLLQIVSKARIAHVQRFLISNDSLLSGPIAHVQRYLISHDYLLSGPIAHVQRFLISNDSLLSGPIVRVQRYLISHYPMLSGCGSVPWCLCNIKKDLL